MTAIKLPAGHIPCDEGADLLLDVDGNAGSVMATVTRALRKAGNTRKVIDAYRVEAMSGDYDHLLNASATYLEGE